MPYGDDEYPYDDYDNDNDRYLWRRATNQESGMGQSLRDRYGSPQEIY